MDEETRVGCGRVCRHPLFTHLPRGKFPGKALLSRCSLVASQGMPQAQIGVIIPSVSVSPLGKAEERSDRAGLRRFQDQPYIGGLPIAHNLEIAEILPVREYADFAEDVRQRWGARAQT
jgi:hypothetical protein